MGLKLRVRWQACASAVDPAPLAVVLPWIWAEHKYIDKYARLLNAAGWDALIAEWPMQAMWFPLWTHGLALSLLQILGSELLSKGERPLVIYVFSGSVKGIFSSFLTLLSGGTVLTPEQAAACSAVLRCCCGVVYDSAPVDFTSASGRRLLISAFSSRVTATADPSASAHSPAGKLAAAAKLSAQSVADWSVAAGAGLLDFFLLEVFDRDREAMWSSLRHPPIPGPFLFLYSRSDDLADAAQISDLAASLRQQGRVVTEQVWQDSPHCGHYRNFPVQYEESVQHLLTDALLSWAERRGRIEKGRQLAARWHDKDLTQQQLDEQALSARKHPSSYSLSQQQPTHQQQRAALMRKPARGLLPVESACCVQQQRYGQQLRPHNRSHKLQGSMTDSQPSTSCVTSSGTQGSHSRVCSAGLKPEADYHGQPLCSDACPAAQSEVICAETAASTHTLRADSQAARLQQQRWHQSIQWPTSRIRNRL